MIPDEAVEAALAALYPQEPPQRFARDVWVGTVRTILEAAAPHLTKYPHESGDCVVLGPETFTNKSADTICHKGQNYYLGDNS